MSLSLSLETRAPRFIRVGVETRASGEAFNV